MSAKGPKGTFWANREILYLDGVFITWVYIFVKMQIMYFKWFHFIEYKLCPLKNIKMLFCGGIYKVIVFPKTFIAPFTRYFQTLTLLQIISETVRLSSHFINCGEQRRSRIHRNSN